jgi:thiamine-phosphate pyrophosphorylase
LVLSLPTGIAPQWQLCVLVTGALCVHHSWEGVVEGAIAGGADCIQLREKDLCDSEVLGRAMRLVEMCRGAPHRVATIVNDRGDIAMASGADGVHLGQGDLPVRRARAMLGSGMLIGVSTSSVGEAREAKRLGADYIGLGPMFSTTTKVKDRLAGPGLVREVLADEVLASVPHLAIGGITPERMPELRRAGVRGVAVSSVVCGAEDPAEVCRALCS